MKTQHNAKQIIRHKLWWFTLLVTFALLLNFNEIDAQKLDPEQQYLAHFNKVAVRSYVGSTDGNQFWVGGISSRQYQRQASRKM